MLGRVTGSRWCVCPPPFVTHLCHQMLKFCCRHPPALEVVLNAYDRIPPAEGWVGTVPPELWEVRGCGAP